MSDDDVDPVIVPPVPVSDYEPPAISDFGPVFKITRGSTNGNGDGNGQRNN